MQKTPTQLGVFLCPRILVEIAIEIQIAFIVAISMRISILSRRMSKTHTNLLFHS